VPDTIAGDDVVLHACLRSQYPDEMRCLLTGEGSSGFVPAICDPAAACHWFLLSQKEYE
jgi:hypothetical protein